MVRNSASPSTIETEYVSQKDLEFLSDSLSDTRVAISHILGYLQCTNSTTPSPAPGGFMSSASTPASTSSVSSQSSRGLALVRPKTSLANANIRVPRAVFTHQLFVTVQDRAVVIRTVADLKERGVIRIMHSPAAANEEIIMLSEEYLDDARLALGMKSDESSGFVCHAGSPMASRRMSVQGAVLEKEGMSLKAVTEAEKRGFFVARRSMR